MTRKWATKDLVSDISVAWLLTYVQQLSRSWMARMAWRRWSIARGILLSKDMFALLSPAPRGSQQAAACCEGFYTFIPAHSSVPVFHSALSLAR